MLDNDPSVKGAIQHRKLASQQAPLARARELMQLARESCHLLLTIQGPP